jgi:hypothetical protein
LVAQRYDKQSLSQELRIVLPAFKSKDVLTFPITAIPLAMSIGKSGQQIATASIKYKTIPAKPVISLLASAVTTAYKRCIGWISL